MYPYYFDFEPDRTRRGTAIIAFERAARRGWPPPRRRRGLPERLDAMWNLIRLWHRRSRERQQLARLDARMLRDIGITPYDADIECSKPFWRE